MASWEFYGDVMVILEALVHLSADFYGNPWHHSSGQTLIFAHGSEGKIPGQHRQLINPSTSCTVLIAKR